MKNSTSHHSPDHNPGNQDKTYRAIPLNWKPSKIFYGWWVVGASLLITLPMAGFVTFGFTAFFEPIVSEFGWSYTQISLASSFRGVEAGLLAPLIGLVVDRWGPRRLMFGGAFIIGLGLIFLSRINSLGMFYGAFVIMTIGTSACSPTVVMTAIANWFRRKVGMATAIAGCGFALGSLMVPVVVRLIDAFGWQTAIFILGVGMWIIGLPLSLLIRHKPEQYGYLPDGEQMSAVIHHGDAVPSPAYEVNISMKQALKSRALWHIGLALALMHLPLGAVILHVMPYLSSVGVSRLTASLVATATPLVSIIGRFISGWLGDKFDKKLVTTGFTPLICFGLLFFMYASSEAMWVLVPFIILFGIGWGGTGTLRAALLREYFGRRSFGAIFGLTMGMTAVGTVIGPLFAGWVFDNWGSYHVAWVVFTVFTVAALIIMATTPSASTGRPIGG